MHQEKDSFIDAASFIVWHRDLLRCMSLLLQGYPKSCACRFMLDSMHIGVLPISRSFTLSVALRTISTDKGIISFMSQAFRLDNYPS